MKVALVTDSTADLPKPLRERLGVRVVPLYVNLGGRVYRDWEEITPEEIFQKVREGTAFPTTSQPSPEDFLRAYQSALEEADHVLSVHISSKLSGTVQSAELAAQNFPGRVSVFDTQAASLGIGMMVLRAHELLAEGKSLEEVLGELKRLRQDHFVRFSVATLEFLKRGGRIGGAQALLGTLLGIKPILTLKEGRVEAAGRARGERKAREEIVRDFRAWAEGRARIRAFFLYSAEEGAVKELKEMVLASGLPVEEALVSELGAVIASHTGPGTYGFYAYSL
ncbi:MAG: DegV family protein [Thermus sp.]|uniref:DegV family protein n=1 Tax=unclassified Thermus TaxID=2619321 RepID=UPI000238A3EB|nr:MULTISPECIES: DegV family protein [unclassified Thermus]AEV16299.1 DegV [Thermus sp. CCB_US3_UF1]MCS6867297.1 DegV family protein [Thermus sp.]MCS7218994.1 DegV family protein [Thermus sp.]MCX7850380.1 DegV family protein [Thermus sp.]MDW8018416.1 DegV family protein [Thermus sp.]